jgi:ABC-type polar amino acid transport system ATPase subunit
VEEVVEIVFKELEIPDPVNLSLGFLHFSLEEYFPEGFKQGEVCEILGTSGSGKTLALFLLLVTNSNKLFPLDKKKSKVIYFDPMNQFVSDFLEDFFKVTKI